MHSKKVLKGLWVVAIIIFVTGFYLGGKYGQSISTASTAPVSQNQNQPQTVSQTASLMIDYENGRVDSFNNLPITSSSTVFDLLNEAASKNKIGLTYKNYGSMGAFIETIGGVGNDSANKKWWQFWVNNEPSQVGASGYVLKPGDFVEFKFIAAQNQS